MRDDLIRNLILGSEKGFNHSKSMHNHNEKFSLESGEFDSGGASSIGVQEKVGFSFKTSFSLEKNGKNAVFEF